MSKWKFALAPLLVGAITLASATETDRPPIAEPASTAVREDDLLGSEVEALFSPGTDPASHAAAKKRAIKLAMAGDGSAAFDLGVLYRHGMDHPARAVERDLETARHWLEKCVESPECPRMALASLAELELQAGNYRAAMQWAQASATLEQKLDKVDGLRHRTGESAYSVHLLKRCFEYLPKKGRDEAVAQAFGEFLARRGKQLDRMLLNGRDGRLRQSRDWAEFAAARNNHPVVVNRMPKVPSQGLFLLRAAPEGGRAEGVVLIEALPSPRAVLGLDGIAKRFESKAYQQTEAGERLYGFIPVAVADPRYALEASVD